MKIHPARQLVEDFMISTPGEHSPQAVADAVGVPVYTASQCLLALVHEGKAACWKTGDTYVYQHKLA